MFSAYFKKMTKTHNKKSNAALDFPFLPYQEERVGAESYKNNSIVHRCVSLIATSASHIPWQVYKDHGSKRELLLNHPAAGLLKSPNPEKSGTDFFTESISSLLLYGSSYILSAHANSNKPSEMYNLHPTMVEHIHSARYLVAYKYRGGNREQIFQIDPVSRIGRVLHLRSYNPSDQQPGVNFPNSCCKADQSAFQNHGLE